MNLKLWQFLYSGLAALALGGVAPEQAAAAEDPAVIEGVKYAEVQDLRYGVALFHFFQGQYMEALTELMIAKERGGIQGHGENPIVMEGGFTLAYGMERRASEIFEEVLERNASPAARSAAWFYIAKVRYLRRDYLGAQQAISNMLQGDYEELGEESVALRINIAIQQEDIELAERILKREKPKGEWLPYINFNLGSAWARRNEFNTAVAYLTLLAEETYESAELRALHDKAMTAAGYSLLLDSRYDDALKKFSKVRLTSFLSGRALLGYGWAAAEGGDYEEALKAWDHLRKRRLVDENSQEALIAVPYAYEKLGAKGLALERFIEAEQVYLDEIDRVEEVINNLQGENMFEALQIRRSVGIDWLNYAKENQLSPQITYLVRLFAREEFQELVQKIRDLLAIQDNQQAWLEKTQFYSEMLEERESDRDLKSAFVLEETLRTKIDTMSAERSAMAKQIEEITANRDYFALATENEADLVRRLQRDKKHVSLLQNEGPFIDEFEEAVRRYYGLLLWDSAEQFSDRLWVVIRKLNALDKTISEIRKNYADVRQVLREAPKISAYQARLSQARARILAQRGAVEENLTNLEGELRTQIVAALHKQRDRLNVYLSQSRLSVARIYDKTRVEALKTRQEPQ